MILNHDEYDVLNKIACKSGMDCWFSIKQGKNGDYVFDLENRKAISLRKGVKDLIDGCIDVNIECLIDSEKLTLIKLLGNLI